MFLNISVTQLHPQQIWTVWLGLSRSTFLDNLTVRPVCGWDFPGMGLLFLGSVFDWQEVSLSDNRALVTHSCSHTPQLSAGTWCSVAWCWVAEWLAEWEEGRALLEGSTGVRLVCWVQSCDCWHWEAPSVCSAFLSYEVFSIILPPFHNILFCSPYISPILFFLLWQNTYNIKFTILAIFKYAVQWR